MSAELRIGEGASAAAEPVVSTSAIEVRGLAFSYPGASLRVLDGVDWDVPQGAFALLVGGTGSGKSTLLSLLKPEMAPAGERAGTARICGMDAARMDARASAGTVGYVFQNPDNQLVCESVWHEMAFGLENLGTSQDEMRRLIAETCYFFGIDDWFHVQTDTLSGGRKQLLALASTLVMQPRVLLLDEPTAQLDPVAERTFLHALFRVNRELGCTVVVATHRPQPMVDYATCAFELVDGHVQALESVDGLRVRADLGVTEAPAPAADRLPVLSLEQAWFRYERQAPWILRGLDLEVRPGSIHALVGGNGCGKSTLLTLAAGSAKLVRGRVRAQSQRRVLLPQDPRALFAAESASDELMEWAPRSGYSAADAQDMLGRMGLAACTDTHPYDLSGGQMQLLALAKLLLAQPDVLLLDEPTKGLDTPARRAVARVLVEQRALGRTVLMATHDLDFARQVADTVSMMFDGQIASTEPVAAFFANNVYYRA